MARRAAPATLLCTVEGRETWAEYSLSVKHALEAGCCSLASGIDREVEECCWVGKCSRATRLNSRADGTQAVSGELKVNDGSPMMGGVANS